MCRQWLVASALAVVITAYGATELTPDSIADYSMMECGCESVVIPATARYVGTGAFAGSPSLKEVIIEGSETRLMPYAFSGCQALERVICRACSITERCFSRCESLKTLVMGDSVKEIGDGAFAGCLQLSEVEFPETIERIGRDAFAHSGLETIDLSSTAITGLSDEAFAGCGNLCEVRLPAGLVQMGEKVFFGDTSLVVVEMPALASVPALAFACASRLTDLSAPLGEGLGEIGDFAFAGLRDVKVLQMPSSLSYIGVGAFERTMSLDTIECRSLEAVPSLGSEVWAGVNCAQVSLLASEEMAPLFASAPQWSSFAITRTTSGGGISADPIENIECRFEGAMLLFRAMRPLRQVKVFDIEGRLVGRWSGTGDSAEGSVDTSRTENPFFIIEFSSAGGGRSTMKLRR
ncbi:MAG: leucine-rich repeat domain-containing protein [Duncaniella sp.]|nr:leucine-rich repeat domain-containing protein [Duncaniella sp.]